MTDNEIIKAWDILAKLDFFGGQRAGRELWNEKPVDVQNEDIDNFKKDIAFLKEFINRQKAEIERLKEEVKIHIKKSVAKRKYDRALIESEAIKDFTEGLKEYGRNTLLTNRIIDNFTKVYLKETAGDNDESTL